MMDGESRMAVETQEQTVTFVVPGIASDRNAMDLANTLTSLNGVAHVAMDRAARSVSVRFDPDYANREIVEGTIEGSGYRVESRG